LFAASRLIQGGFIDEGLAEVEKINSQNPRNLDSIILFAETYEQIGNFAKAIAYREKLADLDPWNATNYLELGKNYKAVGDLNKSQKMLDKILSFVPNGPIAEQAIKELVF
jgi:tetratricopeptide (TPR) repeat protein